MWNEITGENEPCPLCKDELCNGACRFKKRKEAKPIDALKAFLADNEPARPVNTVSFNEQYRQRMRELGKIGGAITAKRGTEYYKAIRKLRT